MLFFLSTWWFVPLLVRIFPFRGLVFLVLVHIAVSFILSVFAVTRSIGTQATRRSFTTGLSSFTHIRFTLSLSPHCRNATVAKSDRDSWLQMLDSIKNNANEQKDVAEEQEKEAARNHVQMRLKFFKGMQVLTPVFIRNLSASRLVGRSLLSFLARRLNSAIC